MCTLSSITTPPVCGIFDQLPSSSGAYPNPSVPILEPENITQLIPIFTLFSIVTFAWIIVLLPITTLSPIETFEPIWILFPSKQLSPMIECARISLFSSSSEFLPITTDSWIKWLSFTPRSLNNEAILEKAK